jgi:eukaryotic-like serine/threonine-protein kinase
MNTCPQCKTTYPPHVRICAVDGTVLDQQPAPAAADPNLGTLLAGKYRLESLLGRGGMGAVYKATHVMLGRPVAVKMIKPDLVGSPEMVRRFQREARAATSLDHPHIVRVYDLGETDDGTLYIAMEFVEGATLKDAIRSGGPMAPERIARFAAMVASALSTAHRQHVVHRDLKPQNLVLTTNSQGQESLKLLDFGIAKTFEDGATQLTAAGYALGTPHYMAPEQATGKEIDGRADIYALGVIVYEMLVGDVPFNDASTPAILIKHMTEPPEPPSRRRPGIHPALETIALTCLEKDPQRRYQSASDVTAALRDAFPNEVPSATREFTGLGTAAASATDAATIVTPSPAPAVVSPATSAAPPAAGTAAQQPAASVPAVVPVAEAVPPPRPPVPEPAPAPPPPPATRPTMAAAVEPPVAAAAASAPAARKGSTARLLVVLGGVAALLFLAVGAAGFVAYRAWTAGNAPVGSVAAEAPPATPTMATHDDHAAGDLAAGAPAAPADLPGPQTDSVASAPAAPAPPPAPRAPATGAAGTTAAAAPAGLQSASASPGSRAIEAPARTTPPDSAAPPVASAPVGVPESPAVFVECTGAAEICGAVRTAFDQALERQKMPSVRRADRADIVVVATASLLDTRHEQQFGTSFAVQTFGLEVSAEAADGLEAIGMPPSRTFSYDPRFGRERATENARLVAGDAADRIQKFWRAKRGR